MKPKEMTGEQLVNVYWGGYYHDCDREEVLQEIKARLSGSISRPVGGDTPLTKTQILDELDDAVLYIATMDDIPRFVKDDHLLTEVRDYIRNSIPRPRIEAFAAGAVNGIYVDGEWMFDMETPHGFAMVNRLNKKLGLEVGDA